MAGEVTVKLSGPIWEAAKDSAKVQAAISKGLLQVGLQGQRMVQEPMVLGHGVQGGYARRSIGAWLMPGKWDQVTVRSNAPGSDPIIYISWLEEGPHGKQRPGKFHGYGFFRDAQSKLEALDPNEMMASEIMKVLT